MQDTVSLQRSCFVLLSHRLAHHGLLPVHSLKTTKLYYTKNYRNYNKVKSVRVVVNRTVRIVTRMVRIVIKIDGWVIGW